MVLPTKELVLIQLLQCLTLRCMSHKIFGKSLYSMQPLSSLVSASAPAPEINLWIAQKVSSSCFLSGQ